MMRLRQTRDFRSALEAIAAMKVDETTDSAELAALCVAVARTALETARAAAAAAAELFVACGVNEAGLYALGVGTSAVEAVAQLDDEPWLDEDCVGVFRASLETVEAIQATAGGCALHLVDGGVVEPGVAS